MTAELQEIIRLGNVVGNKFNVSVAVYHVFTSC